VSGHDSVVPWKRASRRRTTVEPPHAAGLAAVRAAVAAARGGPGADEAVGALADALLAVDPSDTAAGRAALAEVAAVPDLVLRLDEAARVRVWGWSPSWVDRAHERMAGGGNGDAVAAALASMHRDGRVRKAAVVRLLDLAAAGAAAEVVPYLLVRTADWVRPVRDRARAGLAVLLHDAPATLVAAAPTAYLLGRRWRSDFAVRQVDAALQCAPVPLLHEFVAGPDRALARTAFDIAVRRAALPVADLVAVAQKHHDLPVRVRAAEAAAREAVWTARHDLLERLAAASSARVRALGLTGLARAGRDDVVAGHLADPDGTVRALARDAARRSGVDVRAWYRDVLARGDDPPPGALAGLAECRAAVDAEVLERFLDHPRARVRAAAVWGLHHMSAADPRRVAPMVHDPSGRVLRQVTAALRPYAGSLDTGPLWGLLAGPRRNARVAAYVLLRAAGGWAALRAALLLAGDDDPSLSRRGRADCVAWVRHEPTPKDLPPADLAGLARRTARLLGADGAGLLTRLST
jgi:hypothetical protein